MSDETKMTKLPGPEEYAVEIRSEGKPFAEATYGGCHCTERTSHQSRKAMEQHIAWRKKAERRHGREVYAIIRTVSVVEYVTPPRKAVPHG